MVESFNGGALREPLSHMSLKGVLTQVTSSLFVPSFELKGFARPHIPHNCSAPLQAASPQA